MTSSFLRGGCAALALIAATPALAQAPSNADLADLVRAQAAEIAMLKARLDKLWSMMTNSPLPILQWAGSKNFRAN